MSFSIEIPAGFTADSCSPDENVLRAVHANKLDGRTNKLLPKIFVGKGESYSRLKVWSMEQIMEYFVTKLHKPPNRDLVKAVEINVGEILEIARNYKYKDSGKNCCGKNIAFVVREEFDNPSHAQLEPKISPGLAKKFLETGVKNILSIDV